MSALGQKQTFAVQKGIYPFTPNSGHSAVLSGRQLNANSGHRTAYSITSSAFGSHLNHFLYALSAFDLMASLNPRLYPASKWSDLVKSRTLEMLCSSGG